MLDEDEVGIKNLAFENHSKKMFSCKNVRCAYPKVEDCALEKISFDLDDKEMMAVIGPVGAGKSSILNMALNDLEVKSGSIKSNMAVSLAPQEPWIFEGTVRENILLGKEFDEKRYQAVLDASCLDADIKLLGTVNYKRDKQAKIEDFLILGFCTSGIGDSLILGFISREIFYFPRLGFVPRY